MNVAGDVYMKMSVLLASNGDKITEAVIQRLKIIASSVGAVDPINSVIDHDTSADLSKSLIDKEGI